ncbi:dTDP-4-amino-4,6-dideoxygalactose transaminase [Devosia sp. MC521]|nr:dTDP-4-amino-4,6-dideoxygalactose transaminase [Devosia sp. MC521]
MDYLAASVSAGKLSGDGPFTAKCQALLVDRYAFKKVLLTTSCTDALELSALLLGIAPGDEVIVPSYTFVSSANAFALRGAKLVFADSGADNPNVDPDDIARLITPRTRAIVVVHYAGTACDMDAIMALANAHTIPVVEDAAQAIDSYFKGRPLGSIGQFGCFSFHETKNIVSGEGGAIIINNVDDFKRAEIIREKGTNRSEFIRGEVDKYGWVEVGSSFLPSELIAAYLLAQLENVDAIQGKRISAWNHYYDRFSAAETLHGVALPHIPHWATNNAHMFYLVCRSEDERTDLMQHLKAQGIQSATHYLSLEVSRYFSSLHTRQALTNSQRYTDRLLRLPLFAGMTAVETEYVTDHVIKFYDARR